MRRKKIEALLMVVIFNVSFLAQAFAGELSKEELTSKVSMLEKEVAELKTMISNMQAEQSKVEQKVDNIRTSSVISNAAEAPKNAITSKHEIKLYGFLKLDATYDDSKTDDIDASRWAQSKSTAADEKDYAMTARNSRVGLKYFGPEDLDAKVFGNLEMDFYDTSSAHHSTQLRMRHAFFELQYDKWSMLAGQTWDVFGPLGPNTLNTNGYLWNGGNIGFRRAQVRLTNKFELNSDDKITTQLSINRNGDVDANHPVIEARAAYSFAFLGQESTIGIEGLYGSDKEGNERISQWAGGLDLSIPLTPKLSLKGEFFQGANINDFLAGIGQGVNTTTNEGIDTIGGWAQVSYKPWDKYCFNAGYGIDRPQKKDLNSGNRYKNEVVFANGIYSLFKDIKLGLEYAYFETAYLNLDDGENNKITTSLTYNF